MTQDPDAKAAKRARSNKNLKPFKKGETGNRGGRPKESEEFKQLKRLTASELADIGSVLMKGNRADVAAVAQDPTASMLKVAVASVLTKAINKGDMHSLDLLLNRLIGKVKDHHDFSGIPANAPTVTQVIIAIPKNGREKKA